MSVLKLEERQKVIDSMQPRFDEIFKNASENGVSKRAVQDFKSELIENGMNESDADEVSRALIAVSADENDEVD